jgi:mRNA interferase MazF
MQKELHRGQIWIAKSNKGVGSEQQLDCGRPVVIVQNDIGNRYSPTVTICPLTSQNKKWMPTHVMLKKTLCLKKLSTVLVEQVDTVDKVRLIEYISDVHPSELKEINNALMIQLGIVEFKNNYMYA